MQCMSCIDSATCLLVSACVSWWISTGSAKNPPALQQVSHGLNTSAERHPPTTTTLPVAKNKARHIGAQYRTISNSPGAAVPPVVKSKVIFLSSSTSADCNLQSAAVSEYDARCFLYLAVLGFLLTGFPKPPHSQIAAGLRVHLGSHNVLS